MHMLKGTSTKKVQGQKRIAGPAPSEAAKKQPKKGVDSLITKAMSTKNSYFLVTGAVNSLQKKVATHEAPPKQISL
jgi:hypothetical protein